jgi:hypothetical protein
MARMAIHTSLSTFAIGAVLATAACGGSKPNLYDQLLKQNEAALTKRLASLRTILDEAKKRPPLTPPKLAVRGTSELQFIGLEETTQLEQHGYQGQPGCHAIYDGSVYALRAGKGVRQERPDAIADMIRRDFAQTLDPPYAMVCIELSSTAPSKDGEDTFTGGTYSGECRFFDIESSAYLGGVAVSSQMTRAMVNTYNGSGLDDAMDETVTEALGKALEPTGMKPPQMACSWPSK